MTRVGNYESYFNAILHRNDTHKQVFLRPDKYAQIDYLRARHFVGVEHGIAHESAVFMTDPLNAPFPVLKEGYELLARVVLHTKNIDYLIVNERALATFRKNSLFKKATWHVIKVPQHLHPHHNDDLIFQIDL